MVTKTVPHRAAFVITVIYAVFGFLWILLSDRTLHVLVPDDELALRLQTWKGWFYVALTALMIYLLIRFFLSRVTETAQKLTRSEERFAGLLDRLNEAVYRMSLPDGGYEYLSPAMETVFGHPTALFHDKLLAIRDIIHPDSAGYFVEQWGKLLDGEVPPTYEYDVLDADGNVRSIVQTNTGIFDAQGRIIAIEGCCSDVSERRRAEEERLRLEARFRQTQKLESLGLLAGGIAHDFNNLLVSMLGNADLALRELPPGEAAAVSLAEIRKAALRASDLSNQMLAYSGRGRFVISVLDLNELIRELSGLLEVTLPTGVAMEQSLAEGLPAVRADGTQIRQVVMNLITNAGEACASGQGRIRVVTDTLEITDGPPPADVTEGELTPGRHVLIEVSDTGCGMGEATLQRLFDPFFSTKPSGRGLGLAAVLGIVCGHGGAIQVVSRLGAGSRFRLLLPATPEVPESRQSKPRIETGVVARTVLVVDDEEVVRNTARRMLEHLGYDVLLAAGGAEALELHARLDGAIHAVLLDLTMPQMSGEAVFRALRRSDPSIRVILSSGYTADDSAAGLDALSLSGFIQKPYSLDDLASTLRVAFEDSR
jgi:PAS domain S-box-containing protein